MSAEIRWLREAPGLQRTLPPYQRLEITVHDDGVRVQVSSQGSRTVGCVVPWEQLDGMVISPFPVAVERCSRTLIERFAVTLPDPDPTPQGHRAEARTDWRG